MSETYKPDAEMQRLCQALAEIRNPVEVASFLQAVLTPVERRDLALRWALLERLLDGQTQRGIARDLGISLCKITRGARELKNGDNPALRILREQQAQRPRWQEE